MPGATATAAAGAASTPSFSVTQRCATCDGSAEDKWAAAVASGRYAFALPRKCPSLLVVDTGTSRAWTVPAPESHQVRRPWYSGSLQSRALRDGDGNIYGLIGGRKLLKISADLVAEY